jgi:predicted Rossmann fold flavoprotein
MNDDRQKPPETASLVIVGAGAAGLAAAIEAARMLREAGRKRKNAAAERIVILEKNEKAGRKLLATGNGRCNLTNMTASPDSYHGRDPRFSRDALARYSVSATLKFFYDLGLPCREEGDGRVYPVCQQAAAVLDLLRQEADRLQIEILTAATVNGLQQVQPLFLGDVPLRSQPLWQLKTVEGLVIETPRVILATGGQASPNLGSDGSGYKLAAHAGHQLVKPRPALVQIETAGKKAAALSGIRVEAGLSLRLNQAEVAAEFGEVLFTDYGLSGIPILQLSRQIGELLDPYAGAGKSPSKGKLEIRLDLLPELSPAQIADMIDQRCQLNPELPVGELLTGLVHKKIGLQIMRDVTALNPAVPARSLERLLLAELARAIKQFELLVIGTRDFSQAQVTAGGLDCSEFFADRLESRLCPGLFAAGELLDIDGDCGGFNLQWAWSSGRLAGYQAARQILEATM